MMTNAYLQADGKVAFQFGADVFPVDKTEAIRLAAATLRAADAKTEVEVDAPDGVLLTWRPGCYLPIGFREAEELYFQLGDAIWDDQGEWRE